MRALIVVLKGTLVFSMAFASVAVGLMFPFNAVLIFWVDWPGAHLTQQVERCARMVR